MRIDEKSQEQPARQSKEDSQAPWRIEAERATVCEEKVDEESTVSEFTGQPRFSSLRNRDIMSMDCQPVHL